MTQRRLDENELLSLSDALRVAGVALWEWDLTTHAVLRSQDWDRQLGYEAGALPGAPRDWLPLVHPDDRVTVESAVRSFVDSPSASCTLDYRAMHRDGSYRWLRADGVLVRDQAGSAVRVVGSQRDITQRKEQELALIASELRQARMIADAAPHMMWELDALGELNYINECAYRYLGPQPVGRSKWSECVHPDDMPAIERYWQSLTTPNAAEDGVLIRLLRHHDGVYRWFRTRNTVVRDASGNILAYVGCATDVDDHMSAEQALQEAQERLNAALEAAGMGIWVFNFIDQRNTWDRSMLTLLGREEDDAPHTADEVMQTVHPDDRSIVDQAMERAMDPGAYFYAEFRALKPDGDMLWVASKGRAERDRDGRPTRIVGACVDITRAKHLEEQLRQAQKMDAIGQLAGGVAHDFNNILMVILGEAELLLQRHALDPAVNKSLSDIVLAAERAASLTTQLLAFGRRQFLNMGDTNLSQVAHSFSDMLQRMLGERVKLMLSAASDPVLVHADRSMLGQVLLNLTINARDAMPKGGTLRIDVGSALITADEAQAMPGASPGKWAYLLVRDEGEGIRSEVMPRIFEPFFTTKEVGRGTGLGLATVHGIVKQHGGFIHVASQLGVGSTFTVFLPLLAQRTLTASQTEGADTRGTTVASGTNELILLVEDDPAVRAVLRSILESAGYRLLIAQNVRDAMELFSKTSERIHLVLSDVVMPDGLTGADLILRLRSREPRLKAILSSGYSAEGLAQRFITEHELSFLPKPYKPRELLQLIRQVLDK